VELYNLGKVPWEESQLLYHALAKLGRESLCLLSPATPYVCIGFHQDVSQEVDLEFCLTHGIPVFRREVGGGAVFLATHILSFGQTFATRVGAMNKGKIHQESAVSEHSLEEIYKETAK